MIERDADDEELYQLVRRCAYALLEARADHSDLTATLAGFSELVAGIHARPVVAVKFVMPEDDPADVQNLIQHEIYTLVRQVATKLADAQGADSEAVLRAAFSEQKRYLFNDDPRADLIVPILGAQFEDAASLDGLEVIALNSATRRRFSSATEVSSFDFGKLNSATHAVCIRNAVCHPGGYGDGFVASWSSSDEDLIDRFFQAAAVVSRGCVTYGQIGFFPRGWSASITDPEAPFVYLVRDYGVRLDALRHGPSAISGQMLQEIGTMSTALGTAHPSIQVAARRLVMSYTRVTDEDRIIDLSIGLEAILGSGFSETVHRISLRSAALLALAGWGNSKTTYDAMKGMYNYRSRVVHGTPGPHKQDLLKIDGVPIHASRFAVAALISLLQLAVTLPGFHPDKIDEMFIYSAFDDRADALRRGAHPDEAGDQ